MKAKDNTWKTVEEKQEELCGLTKEAWAKDEWELAALGERTLRTVEQSKAEAEEVKVKVKVLKETIETFKRELELRWHAPKKFTLWMA